MYRIRTYIPVVVCSLLQVCCFGNNPTFSSLSVEDGLSSNQVNAIFQDSKGFIWLGTLDGLDRYDGIELKAYSSKYDKPIENVLDIEEDKLGNIWVGTTAGLLRYSPDTDRLELIPIDSMNVHVQALQMLSEGTLGIGTTKGLYLLNTNELETKRVNLPPSKVGQDFNVTDLLLMEGGQCWITTTSGLISYHLHSEKSQVYTCSLGPTVSYNYFTSVCSIGERLYLGTASMGIVEFDRMSHTFSIGIAIDNRLILNLASDGEKFVYAGTNGGGVKIIDVVTGTVENVIARQSKPESLSSNSIYALLLDDDGRFWVGTYSAGLCFSNIVEGSFKVFDLSADHPDINKSIRSFYFDSNGSKYYGTRNGFAATSANGVFNFFQSSHTESLKSNIILSIYPYEAHLLIGTYGGGVSQYSLAEPSMTPFLAHTPLSQGNIYDFAQDSTGALWITSFEGLFRYSPQSNELINFNTQNSTLINDQLFAITFDSKERLWVGSMAGVQALEWGEQGLIPIDLSVIPDNRFKTNYVYEDRDAQIWICTERGGLIQLDPDLTKSTQYRRKDGLPDNSICTIVEDQEGNYWISTLKGLCRFSPAAKAFVKYSMADGIPGLVFTPAASYLQEDGTIYLGNEKGLVHFKPADLDEANSAAKIMITDFYLSGKEVLPQEGTVLTSVMEETQEIRLATQKNDIGFRFISLNYINASNNRYQYKLEGLDQEWKDNGSNNTVFFEDLEAGNYTFRVRNSNDSGLAAANEAQVKIFIRASFFTSSLFYALLLGTVLFGGIVLIRHIQSLPHKIKKKIDHSKSTQKYNGSRISLDRSDAIITELRRQMKEEKLYLNPNLKLLDISNQINYPMNEISQVLNQHLNQNFPDFINKYRVEEVKNLMSQEEFQRFTLVAIAQQCGFNSKTSFYRIFKKETGQTPADYLREYWQRLEKT